MTTGLTQKLAVLLIGALTACGGSETSRSIELELAPEAKASASASSVSVTPRRAKPPTEVISTLMGISIGQRLDVVMKSIGGRATINDFEKEKAEWVELGYDPLHELPFDVGFDQAVTFNEPLLPVYMVFAKNGFVSLIRFSSYVGSPDEARKAMVGEACGLLYEADCVERDLGSEFVLEHVPERGRLVHHYLSLGFSISTERDAVRVIDVYGVLSEETKARITTSIAQKEKRAIGG